MPHVGVVAVEDDVKEQHGAIIREGCVRESVCAPGCAQRNRVRKRSGQGHRFVR